MARHVVWSALCALYGLVAMRPLQGQATGAKPFVGLDPDSVCTEVSLVSHLGVTELDLATTRYLLQSLFDLELSKRGLLMPTCFPPTGTTIPGRTVPVSRMQGFVFLGFSLWDNRDGTVKFVYELFFFEPGISFRAFKAWQKALEDSLVTWKADSTASPEFVLNKLILTALALTWSGDLVLAWDGGTGIGTADRPRLGEGLKEATINAAQEFAKAFLASRPK